MSLFSTLNTGTSGLKASEIGIATSGHNISNANNQYYTRQRLVTQASTPFHSTPGDIGTGVSVTTIVRIHDEFVYSRLKDSSSNLSYDTFTKKSLEEISKYFPDLQDVGIGVDIQNYFASWNDLASNANDGAQKIALVQNAQTLANNLSFSRDNVRALQTSINEQLKTNVDEMNRIGQEIVNLNKAIGRAEALDTSRANDLRDQRDQLELTLSDLINISVFKGDLLSENSVDANLTDQGTGYHMNIAGNSFVDGMTFHPIVIENSTNESNYYSIYSESQDGSRIEITEKLWGGKVGAMLDLRGRRIDPQVNSGFPTDGTLQKYIDDLDTFAKTFIEQTNNIYAQSAQTQMSSIPLVDLKEDTVLSNYAQNINDGSFALIVYDNAGKEVARKTITINPATTMDKASDSNSIIAQFNTNSDDNGDNNTTNDIDDYFKAIYSYDPNSKTGTLSIQPKDQNALKGYKIAFEDNGTNFPGVVGISQFLQGDSASNMQVARAYQDDPDKLNAYAAPIDGNNDVANAMVQLQYETLEFNRKNGASITESIEGFYRFVTTEISTDGESIGRRFQTSEALFNTINAEFQSISGVNIDEELADLMKFQTAYGANAKVITTIDQMLNTLLGIKQ
ncbi:MAG: flagellar hook-associated protein FlgK [Sulfurospirillum sp.]|nr:flagellar hook-associated protein FlgK [Sulfurospirillum sp.]